MKSGNLQTGHVVRGIEPEVRSSRAWPSKEVQHILETRNFTQQDPVLRIGVLCIKDRRAKFRFRVDDGEPPMKQARVTGVKAVCSLTIWDRTTAANITVVEQTRSCEIQGYTKSSGERTASISMSEPFTVSVNELQSQLPRKSPSIGEPSFAMQLVITAAGPLETWPPLDMGNLPIPKRGEYRDAGEYVRNPLLVAKWQRLPHCPENERESLLELLALQDEKKYKPKLSLKIDASWMEPASVISLFNSELRNRASNAASCEVANDASRGSSSSPAPTRNRSLRKAEDDRSVPKALVNIEWVFEGLSDFMPQIQFDDYTCPLCDGRTFRDASEFHFHLINSHDLFKFKYSQKFETNDQKQSVARGLIHVDVADNYEERAANTIKDFREMLWVKPRTPFNLEAFLKGDESWLGKTSKRTSSLAVPYPRLESSRSVSGDRSRAEIPISAVTRPPEKVPDLVPPVRKQFRVPAAPAGVKFFRLLAKRPLEEGEMLSESDDDIDEEWLLRKHADTIDSFSDTLPEEKEFIQRFDRHMLREDVSSDLHASEALIRFCRLNRSWLRRRDMRLEFHKKAAALKMQGTLSASTIRACCKIIDSAGGDVDTDDMDVDSPSGERHDRPPTPPEDCHVYGCCAVCKEGIHTMSENLRCSNPTCTDMDHHLGCVGLSTRPPVWLCIACAPPGAMSQEATASTTAPTVFGSPNGTAPNVLPIRSRESSPNLNGCGKGATMALSESSSELSEICLDADKGEEDEDSECIASDGEPANEEGGMESGSN